MNRNWNYDNEYVIKDSVKLLDQIINDELIWSKKPPDDGRIKKHLRRLKKTYPNFKNITGYGISYEYSGYCIFAITIDNFKENIYFLLTNTGVKLIAEDK